MVSYTAQGAVFVPSKPRMWSAKSPSIGRFAYDIAPDGKRVVALRDVEGDSVKPETHLRVLVNVREELRRRAAAGRN